MNAVIQLKNIKKSYEDQEVLHDVSIDIQSGEFLTLLGPSGCGKTTLLKLISGFESPDHGQVLIQNQDMANIPANHRQVHTVFQSYALFPHMTVFDNVAFGLRCQGVKTEEIAPRVQEALAMVKLEGYSKRYPKQLSGGQQQRVAIARAVVNRPLALLLDEPLSSLDYRLRKTMQVELKQLQRQLGMTFIFVTHDQEEALSMSDRIVVMHEGNVEQIGAPREVYEEPCSLEVAKFVGEANIFEVEILESNEDGYIGLIEGVRHRFPTKKDLKLNQTVSVVIRPEDLRVWSPSEVEDTTGMIPGVVVEVVYKGSLVDLMVKLPSEKIILATEFFDEDDADLDYNRREEVWVTWYPGWEVILPHET